MKETDQQLAEILKKGLEAAEKTGNFVVEQAPDLIQQLIVWKTCEYSINILIGLGFIYGYYRWYKNVKKKIENNNGRLFGSSFSDFPMFIIGGSFSLICGFVLFYSNIQDLLQITIAPKIWLIEYASQLIK